MLVSIIKELIEIVNILNGLMSAKYCDEKNRQRAYSSACFLYSCVFVLEEEVTWMAAVGIGLTLIGLFLSESKLTFRKRGM